MKRLKDKPDGKFIEVTGITPDPLWARVKSTASLGADRGPGQAGSRTWAAALRQPSGGPTMNVKGTAAGGGNALLMPMTEFSLGLTGDINDIMNAHNLAMVALNARMQHERNYNDERLAKRGLKRLDVDPEARGDGLGPGLLQRRALRNIAMGIGGRLGRLPDGVQVRHRRGLRADGHPGRGASDLKGPAGAHRQDRGGLLPQRRARHLQRTWRWPAP